MPAIYVCSLAKVQSMVLDTNAAHVVSLLKSEGNFPQFPELAQGQHLILNMSDVTEEIAGEISPNEAHVRELITYVKAWDQAKPIVVHCYAGVSRSTAAAFIATCLLQPTRREAEIAREIRRLSPTATPNIRIVALADAMMAREGRMIAAIRAIGRGEDCYEGVPFKLAIA